MTDHARPTLASRVRALAEHATRPFAPGADNPRFAVDAPTLARELARLRRAPVVLEHPVVVVSGWRAPAVAARMTAARLASLTSRDLGDFLPVSLFSVRSFTQAANALVDAVDARWPSGSPDATTRVDVVAISMGGLASRLAGAPREIVDPVAPGLRARRLSIARLFTLATPHRGASLTGVVAVDAPSRDMRPGSPLLRALDDALARDPIEIVPYTRLRDGMVGARNTAPPGMCPLWVDGPPALSHLAITTDRRIMLDLALRLRGEPPVAQPGKPPPRQ